MVFCDMVQQQKKRPTDRLTLGELLLAVLSLLLGSALAFLFTRLHFSAPKSPLEYGQMCGLFLLALVPLATGVSLFLRQRRIALWAQRSAVGVGVLLIATLLFTVVRGDVNGPAALVTLLFVAVLALLTSLSLGAAFWLGRLEKGESAP